MLSVPWAPRASHREQPPPPLPTALTAASSPCRRSRTRLRFCPEPGDNARVQRLPLQESTNLRASDRAAQKIRRAEQGHEYAAAQLLALGAPRPRPGYDPALWLREALVAVGARNVRHRGVHRFCGRLPRVAAQPRRYQGDRAALMTVAGNTRRFEARHVRFLRFRVIAIRCEERYLSVPCLQRRGGLAPARKSVERPGVSSGTLFRR